MAEMADLGVRLFTDDGTGVQDDRLMRRALEYAARPRRHAGPALRGRGARPTAATCTRASGRAGSASPGSPAEAEELMVMRDIALARLTGARVHFQHLSTAGSVDLVRAAKAGGPAGHRRGHPAPLHPHRRRAAPRYDPVFKVNPPLRTDADVAAVKAGLADGTIDAIATDHAPHAPEAKERPFDEAPPRDARPRDGAGPGPHRARPAASTEVLGAAVVAAGRHRRPRRRPRRPDRRRAARQPRA